MNKVIAIVTLLAIILVGYDYYSIRPGLNNYISSQRQTNLQLESDLETALKAKSEIEMVRKEISNLKSKTAMLLEKLPQKKEAGTLLEQITKISTGKGFSIEKVTPGLSKKHKAKITTDKNSGEVNYTEMQIKMEIISTFKELGKYLESVERLPRLVDITGFKTAPLDAGNRLITSMNVKTYVYGGK
jgi:Tfp pilus assembly protein PilO